MFVIGLFLGVVLRVAAAEDCREYCESKLAHPTLENLSQYSSCDCTQKRVLRSLKDIVETSDSGTIFYEPAENNLRIPVANPFISFMVLNPVKFKDHSAMIYSFEPKSTDDEDSSTSLHTNDKETPVYLDVGLKNPNGIEARSNDEGLNIAQSKLTECLDLHIFIVSRKNSSTIESALSPHLLRLYENLSDEDLASEIQHKCNESDVILKNSLQMIQDSQPKRQKVENFASTDTFDGTSREQEKNSEENSKGYEDTNEREAQKDFHENNNSFAFLKIDSQSEENHKFSKEDLKNYSNLESRSNAEIDSISSATKLDQFATSDDDSSQSKEQYENSARDSIVEENGNLHTANSDHIIDSLEQRNANFDENASLSVSKSLSSPTDENLTPNSRINDKNVSQNAESSEMVLSRSIHDGDRNNSQQQLHSESSDEEEGTNENDPRDSETESSYTQQVIEKNPLNSENRNIRFPNRPVYTEDEIHIPSLETKEFVANATSFNNGFEKLPNEDFKNDTAVEQTKPQETLVTGNDSDAIVGKLFFVFNETAVPAQFVQQQNGIHVGLDGNYLCDQLKNSTSSTVMSVLCKSARGGK